VTMLCVQANHLVLHASQIWPHAMATATHDEFFKPVISDEDNS